MEYLELGDLHQHLATTSAKVLQETEAQVVIFQVLEGIHYMHENGFAHRDLKPSVCLPILRFPRHNLTLLF